jgi:iron complex transport system ATP-binding protein
VTRVDLEHVSIAIRGRHLLSDISLSWGEGEFLALVGPNGAGKTTLLKAALGLVRAGSGRVVVDDRAVTSMSPRERAAHLAWLPQRGLTEEPLRAEEVVASARYRFREAYERSIEHARRALSAVGAAHLAERRVTEMSGGERQRVALAAMLAQRAPLLLLDEPANHLDPAQQIEAYVLLSGLFGQGLGIVCVTHDINLLGHVARADRIRVVGLREGRIAFDTSYGDDDLPARLSELFSIPMQALPFGGRRIIVAQHTSTKEPVR